MLNYRTPEFARLEPNLVLQLKNCDGAFKFGSQLQATANFCLVTKALNAQIVLVCDFSHSYALFAN